MSSIDSVTFPLESSYTINPIGFGCLQLTEKPALCEDPERKGAIAVVKSAYSRGGVLFDTADFYGLQPDGTGFGENEKLLGRAFAEIKADDPDFRTKCIISSKGGVKGFDASGPIVDNSKAYLKAACERSLERMGLAYFDIYYLHRHDDKTSYQEVIDTLVLLLREGKIKHIGLSEVSPTFLLQAHRYAKAKYDVPVSVVQTEYSIASREVEDTGLRDVCQGEGITLVAYGSLSRKLLTDEVTTDFKPEGFTSMMPRFEKDQMAKSVSSRTSLDEMAASHACSTSQLALKWLISQGHIIPIPGTTNPDHLRDNFDASRVDLPAGTIASLSDAYPRGSFAPRYPDYFPESVCDQKAMAAFEAAGRDYRRLLEKGRIAVTGMAGVGSVPAAVSFDPMG